MAEITYTQVGDYLIPDITMEETPGYIGKYGLMRQEYLKKHKQSRYSIMLLKNTLDRHLVEVEAQASQRVEELMKELLKKDPAPDKMSDTMAWTRHMNRIKAQAEEVVIAEIIYS